MQDRKLILRVAIKLMAFVAVSLLGYVFFSAMINDQQIERETEVVHIDVSSIKPGEVKFFNVLNKKLLVLHRTPEMLNTLDGGNNELLKDVSTGDLANNLNKKYRSFSPKYFVAYAYDPFYGCEIKLSADIFVPVCIDLKYDLSGRVYKSRRAEDNLIVPRHDVGHGIKNNMIINIYRN